MMGLFGRSKRTPEPQHLTNDLYYGPQQYASQQYASENYSSQQPPPYQQYQPYGPPPPTPPGWMLAPSHLQPQRQPILIQNNYLLPPPLPARNRKHDYKANKLVAASSANLPSFLQGDVPDCIPGAQIFNDEVSEWHRQGTQYLNQGAAIYDLISSRFDSVLTLIDSDTFGRDEEQLAVLHLPEQEQGQEPEWTARGLELPRTTTSNARPDRACDGLGKAISKTDVFTKWKLYANSRVPGHLPPVKFYMSTIPLLCIAAQYSDRVYQTPRGEEWDEHIAPNARLGTKAMVIKSVPVDSQNVIVFAIRGSARFLDWAVNMNQTPSSPTGFLDDTGNLCHAGFLDVARSMIKPVAARLRYLLQEDPSRSRCSLLITGHSAGGAVAALLYSHMLSSSPETESDLRSLAGFFKRIHCVTFGSPPISLLPLQKPQNRELRKSLFLSFINEGDPVARASIAYVQSVLNLYLTPAPKISLSQSASAQRPMPKSILKGTKTASSSSLSVNNTRQSPAKHSNVTYDGNPPIWRVPNAILSNGGKIVLLRAVPRNPDSGSKMKTSSRAREVVQARLITDEQLRGVIFGEMVAHSMDTYLDRIEMLASNALKVR